MPAQGQGTMNNVTLGNDRFTYYETIGGGQGACPDADGPSAVHVTMSNTLSTPVEALELSYPLRVERNALRLGSGGGGAFAAATASSASCACSRGLPFVDPQRAPAACTRGASGGGDGLPGRNLVNGVEVPAKVTLDVSAGDVVTIETPGGGGFGEAAGGGWGRASGGERGWLGGGLNATPERYRRRGRRASRVHRSSRDLRPRRNDRQGRHRHC